MDTHSFFQVTRNSRMFLNEIYFWTSSVKDWKHILTFNKYQALIIQCWKDLADKRLIAIYGFVIMPNHLHIIWEMKGKNGREMPYASF